MNRTTPWNGERSTRMSEQTTSRQLLPNETTMITRDRTCTQRLTSPSLEKYDSSSANMCWRKFVQYAKLTKEIDLSTNTTSSEILPQYREELELVIDDIFVWVTGQSARTEMTKTVRK